MLYGNTQHNLPSRFIADIPEEIISEPVTSQIQNQVAGQQETEPFYDEFDVSAALVKGDRVTHPLFGTGEVLSVEGSEAVINFSKGGKKVLNLQYAPLQKL